MLWYHMHSQNVAVSVDVARKGCVCVVLFIFWIVAILLMAIPSSNGVDGFSATQNPTFRRTMLCIPTNALTTDIVFSNGCRKHHPLLPTIQPSRLNIVTTTTACISARLPSLPQRSMSSSSLFVADSSENFQSASTATTNTDNGISMTDAVFGIIKAMVGSGLLALASGLATVTNVPSHLYMAHVLLVGMSIISAYTFMLYGKLVHATQAQTLGELWKTIYTNSCSSETPATSTSSFRWSDLTVSMATFIFCFGACIAYSLTFGDMCSSFVQGMVGFCTGSSSNGYAHPTIAVISNFLLSRQASILLITGSIVLPLCRLPSLAALAPTSILGVLGTLVTIGFLGYRCPAIIPTSPYSISSVGVGSTMLSNIMQQPSFSTYSRIQSPAPLIFIAMACVSYMAHFSAPDFYHSLVGTKPTSTTTLSTNNNTSITRPIKRYNQMTITGYVIVTLLNMCALTFGFLTFGGGCAGVILNNYNNIDFGAIVSRLLVGISVIGSYPFVMNSCRNAALEVWNTLTKTKLSEATNTSQERRMTSVLLGVITSIALITKDVGFVISFNGAVMGSTIAFTFPAMLFLKFHRQNGSASTAAMSKTASSSISKFDVWACRGLVGFGVVSSIVGGLTTIIGSFAPHLLSP